MTEITENTGEPGRCGKSFIPVDIKTSAGLLSAAVHLPAKIPAPVVVCCHGLLSSKESEKFVGIGETLSTGGLVAVRFDFSGCGQSTAELGKDLLSSRIRDLDSVLEYVLRRPWANGRIGLLGSSLGGYLALLAAASGTVRAEAVVCWATPFSLEKIHLVGEASDAARKLFPPGFAIGNPANLLDLPPLPRVLIIHGQNDEIVPWKDAYNIYRRLGDPKRLLIVETADHRFLDQTCRQSAIWSSLDWFYEQGLGCD
ncbi:MAG: alpha/beta hydrolase family protein [Syntrophobacteraceae bacterium]